MYGDNTEFLYDRTNVLHIIKGSATPTFRVQIAEELSGATMAVKLSDRFDPSNVVLTKECTASEGWYEVFLTNAETENLHGAYFLDFVLTTSGGLQMVTLRACLVVD